MLAAKSKRRPKSATPGPHRAPALCRVFRLNRPELLWLLLGTLAAIVTGISQPAFALLYSEIYQIFTLSHDPATMRQRIDLVAGVMAVLGLLRLISSAFQSYFFGLAGQRLTKRLRTMLFGTILRQELAWFDLAENQVGVLTNRLASETGKVHTLTGHSMGGIVESVVLLVASFAIGFYYSWPLTLIVLAFLPVIMTSSFLQIGQLRRSGSDEQSEILSIRLAHEALSANQTVAAFGLQQHFQQRYCDALSSEQRSVRRVCVVTSLVYALAQSVPVCSYAAAFSFGAYLLSQGRIEMIGIFRVFAAISFAAQALGRKSHLGPEMKQASEAAKRIFALLDRKPLIPSDEGLVPKWNLNEVPIEFRAVSFRYPARPNVPVLTNFSCGVAPNETVALVGPSGCGKTSLFNLLLRFYAERRSGSVQLNGEPISRIQPRWLRSQTGLVDQEPDLFDVSLRENIAYGDNQRDCVPFEEVVDAARQAQAHDFILSLPQGYDTRAGPRGSALSGGEKQRVALARTLLRRPRLLLLDEATSALDAGTEHQVQTALEGEGTAGRTTLVIAHRLRAVKSAQRAVVIQDGVCVQEGPTEKLLREQSGLFWALYGEQMNQQ